MKRNGQKPCRNRPHTLADLVATVTQLTNDERLTAYIVADMINTQQIRLDGQYEGRRVVVS